MDNFWTEFHWYQMLGNWYCVKGDTPVCLVKLEMSEYRERRYYYWFFRMDMEGWCSADYFSLAEMISRMEEAFNDNQELLNKPASRTINRYERKVWEGEYWEDTVYDVYYIDRLTGKQVLRYDGADPANTNSHYGAESDYWKLSKRGYDMEERIPAILGM